MSKPMKNEKKIITRDGGRTATAKGSEESRFKKANAGDHSSSNNKAQTH
jgi:hypothetical protein